MMDPVHRRETDSVDTVQRGNRAWWTRNTMSYDWRDPTPGERYSLPWFEEVDRRFVEAARLFATETMPFDRMIPMKALAGRGVLEIGCGMGFHSETFVRAGAKVTAIDISPTSVEATTTRLRLKRLAAEILQGDAENLPFQSASFDFVWSWGVIHHSSRTARIVREIARVLRPNGEARVMVYNRTSPSVVLGVLRDQLFRGGFGRRTWDESLHATTDGFSARHYTQDLFEDLFRAFFRQVSSEICGQPSDVIPLPRRLRGPIIRVLSESYLRSAQARRGSFIFLRARDPE